MGILMNLLAVIGHGAAAAQRSEQITIYRGAVQLAGTLELPESVDPVAAVVMVQGSAAFDRSNLGLFDTLAHRLASAGIASLRVDDRGVGGSGGTKHDLSAGELAEDVAALHAFLLSRPEADPERVGLLGHSFGGALASIVADRTDDVAFVITLAGYAVSGEQLMMDGRKLLEESRGTEPSHVTRVLALQHAMFQAAKSGGPWTAVEQEHHALRQIEFEWMDEASRRRYGDLGTYIARSADEAVLQLARRTWFPSFLSLDASSVISRLRLPFLAVFGEADTSVPSQLNVPSMMAALSTNPQGTVYTVSDADHFFRATGNVSDEMLSLIVSWLAEHG